MSKKDEQKLVHGSGNGNGLSALREWEKQQVETWRMQEICFLDMDKVSIFLFE